MSRRVGIIGLIVLVVVAGSAVGAGSASAEAIGSQTRVSQMGPNGDLDFEASNASVAYNSAANEHLVVWNADDGTAPLVDGEFEIFGRRMDASGNPIGGQFRISDMGPDGSLSYYGEAPSVAYDAATNEYLVVWFGTDNTPPLVAGEAEIFGQRLSAAGTEVGANDFRISDMGANGVAFAALNPSVTYNSAAGEYFVTWFGDDDVGGLIDNEAEIFGQRLNGAGADVGPNDFRISDMGPNTVLSYSAYNPSVTYNSAATEYMVVWYGNDTLTDTEIFGQRVSAAGADVGPNDFRISAVGPDGSSSYYAENPVVAYGSATNEYLVAWDSNDDVAPLDINEVEIFGQRVSAAGSEVGADDFRISDMGPNGSGAFAAFSAAVAYDSHDNEYQVSWSGDDNTPPLSNNIYEIFGQRIAGAGGEVGPNDFQISQIGPNGNTVNSGHPAVAYDPATDEFLNAWEGDDNTPPSIDEEFEIFARRSGLPPAPGPGPDKKAPGLKLAGSKTQKALKKRILFVFATCDEPCTVSASASLSVPKASKTFKLKKVKRTLAANKRTKITLKISKKAAKAAKRALKKGKRVTATVNLTATDAAGNATKGKRKIKLKR